MGNSQVWPKALGFDSSIRRFESYFPCQLGAFMSDGGKGSKPRPISVSNEEYAARWDAIFAKPVDEIAEAAAERALLQMVDLNERLGLYKDQE